MTTFVIRTRRWSKYVTHIIEPPATFFSSPTFSSHTESALSTSSTFSSRMISIILIPTVPLLCEHILRVSTRAPSEGGAEPRVAASKPFTNRSKGRSATKDSVVAGDDVGPAQTAAYLLQFVDFQFTNDIDHFSPLCLFEHDLFRKPVPTFRDHAVLHAHDLADPPLARRNIKPSDNASPVLRTGGQAVPTPIKSGSSFRIVGDAPNGASPHCDAPCGAFPPRRAPGGAPRSLTLLPSTCDRSLFLLQTARAR